MQRKNPPKPTMSIHIIIFAALIAGAILGGFAAAGFYGHVYFIGQNIYESFRALDTTVDSSLGFQNSALRHMRTIILVWVLGFLYAGIVFQALLIGMRGFFIGYGVSMFVIRFSVHGLFLAVPAIVLQNIMLIIVLFLIIVNSARQELKFSEKLMALLLALACAIIISLYETYLSPPICLWLFNRII